jgi:DNA polymerase II
MKAKRKTEPDSIIEKAIFILTDEWQDVKGRNILRFIGKSNEYGPVEVIISNNKPVFFVGKNESLMLNVPFKRKTVDMKTFDGVPVDAVYFNSQKDLKSAAEQLDKNGVTTFESDVDPVRRFLMEKSINAQMLIKGEAVHNGKLLSFKDPDIKPFSVNPEFSVLSVDIETSEKNTLLVSIAVLYKMGKDEIKKVFMLGDEAKGLPEYIRFYRNEKELLSEFFSWLKKADPDIIIGWHVIGYDLMYLESKCRDLMISFDLGRGPGRASLRKTGQGSYFASVPGRIVLDGPATLRSAFFSFEDFKLETVAQELLSTGKTITPEQNKVIEIDRLFKEDKIKLAEYNMKDAVLVYDIFKRAGLIELSVERAQLSGMLMDRLGMMSAAFDHFFLPRIHNKGIVAPNVKDLETAEHSAGGYVLDPKPGIYDDIVLLDFKSLYPSIIRTFKIDPYSRLMSGANTIITPGGYKFSSSENFLPDFLDQLMHQRNEAIRRNDKSLSQAIKILMNSFYGVMGSTGCRFYHPHLPSAITSTGQWLLLESKKHLEANGYGVVYGDTDSLFIKLKPDEGTGYTSNGRNIALRLNEFWRERLKNEFNVDSCLELEFEKYYRKFIITPVRGAETGAKKRYVGLVVHDGKETLEFVGMEFVRSDWTRLAKEFQVELYERVLYNKEIVKWINSVVDAVNKGKYDDKLVYRKRLRKDINEYVKNIPPQVKAAKMLSDIGNVVYYVITKKGPVPVELDPKDIDYQHYIERQLKPIADSILVLLGQSFESIVQSGQLSFFNE